MFEFCHFYSKYFVYFSFAYDNGFMVEAGGRNKKGDYVSAKILCNTLDEVLALVKEAGEMELDN